MSEDALSQELAHEEVREDAEDERRIFQESLKDSGGTLKQKDLLDAILEINNRIGRKGYIESTLLEHVSILTLVRATAEVHFIFKMEEDKHSEIIREAMIRVYTRGYWEYDDGGKSIVDWKEYVRKGAV